jgi:predicted CXXCH cytochrome family protein
VVAAARVETRAVARDLGATRDMHGGAYVGSRACRACHEEHYRSWGRTFHRTMTTEASAETVAGDFSGATLRHAGVEARMDRDGGGGFRMTFSRPGAAPVSVSVARTVGSRRYQQYLARVGDTFWRLPVAYSVEERRWFPMTGAFLFPDDAPAAIDPSRPVFGGGLFDRHVARWNDNCVFCHNVAPNPGRDARTGAFDTRVAELGVACEACHGPGAEHARANADPVRRYVLHARGGPDPTIVDPARLSPARAADLCGRCHGQRLADDVGPFLAAGDPFVPGDDLGLYTAPLWRDTALAGDRAAFSGRFWPDGTARLTAYEYQGVLQSACAARGSLTCTSCHGMHEGDPRGQIRARFDGSRADGMCTGCHAALATPAAAAAHGHHDPAGAGGRCVACHMPRVVYGVLDVHRSHRIEIPDPARAAALGRPDACTGCHVTERPAWAAAALARLWGRAAPAPVDAAALAAARAPVAAVFAGDAIARAVAADALGRASAPEARAARGQLLGDLLEVMAADRYPAVRQIAWRAARRLGAPDGASAFDPAAERAARAAAVDRLRRLLGSGTRPTGAARAAAAPEADVEIGE